jgi:hypothetical protein
VSSEERTVKNAEDDRDKASVFIWGDKIEEAAYGAAATGGAQVMD